MFANLMRSELSRLRYRRRAWGSLILVMLAGLVLPSQWMGSIREPTAAEVTLAQAELTRAQLFGECSDCTLAQMQGWWSFERVVHDGIGASAIMIAFFAFMIVVTYVGADFSSGAMSTQLTFTPRRVVLLAARALACGVLGAVLMLVGLVTATSVTIIGYLSVNGSDSIGAAPGLLNVMVGGAMYGFLIGVIAALVTFVIPSTPIAMAAAVVVLVITGLIDDGSFTPLSKAALHMMPMRNGNAVILGDHVVERYNQVVSVTITRADGLVFHLVVILALLALAAFLFERRDIKG